MMSSIRNELEAVESIGRFATGAGGFENKVVKRLATYFQSMFFTSPVRGAAQGVVQNYWVGFFVDTGTADGKPHTKPALINFSQTDNFGKRGTNRSQIGSALVVPMVEVVAAVTAPFLVPQTLPFANLAAGPKVVITGPLSACTFAIGTTAVGYVMSHAQPKPPRPNDPQPADGFGRVLAEIIHGRGAEMFENTRTTSTFLIHPGQTINREFGFGYGDPSRSPGYRANIVGFVVSKPGQAPRPYSLRFIVVVTHDPARNNQRKISKVVVIKHKNSKWKVKDI